MPQQRSNRFVDKNGILSKTRNEEPPQWIEFEVQCPAASTIRLEHGFGCPVRFYVTFWRYNGSGAPILSENSASTINTLVLDSGKAGRAVIRVEASPFSLQAGNT